MRGKLGVAAAWLCFLVLLGGVTFAVMESRGGGDRANPVEVTCFQTEEDADSDFTDAEEPEETDNTDEPEPHDGEDHDDEAADANADETDAEGEEEAPANDPFADYPEDDLSDLFADQPAVEEGTEIQEPSPHIAFGATGNVFFYAPAAGHCQATFACPTAYENAINAFLTRCIG